MQKKYKFKIRRKQIGNKSLLLAVSLTLLFSTVVFLGVWVFRQPKESWLKMQASNLTYTLTGGKFGTALDAPAGTIYLPILMYHHVGSLPENADPLRRDMTISTDNFELHVAWLKGQGYEAITLYDLLQYSKGNFQLPEKPVIFTFDDGYEDVFDNALPTLKKYNFKGSFAVITQFAGISQGTNKYATWQQIKQAQREGMEIISHTQDHFDGTNKKYDQGFILRNLQDSQNEIKSSLGSVLPILVYPYGHYDTEYIKLAKQAGFEIGVTTKSGQKINLGDLMQIPRIRIRGNMEVETFKKVVLEGLAMPGNGDY